MWKARGIWFFMIIVWAGWVLAGCSILGTGSTQPIDPPPAGSEVEDDLGFTDDPSEGEENSATAQVTLYLKDMDGFIAPVSVRIPFVEDIAKRALETMVIGGPYESELPEGFSPVLPEGTKIQGINIIRDQKKAVVDFSPSFTRYPAEDERKILESITWTLTEFPSIDRVELWVNGVLLKEMPVNQTPLDEPLTRAMGINVEYPKDVPLSQTSPVVLYFKNETPDQIPYYVPVTRLVEKKDNLLSAVLDQLIRGPESDSGLMGVLPEGTKILDVQDHDSMITVNFSGNLAGPDENIPDDVLQAVVLSLTENRKQAKVQILVDGQEAAPADAGGQQPVSRPKNVNRMEL